MIKDTTCEISFAGAQVRLAPRVRTKASAVLHFNEFSLE